VLAVGSTAGALAGLEAGVDGVVVYAFVPGGVAVGGGAVGGTGVEVADGAVVVFMVFSVPCCIPCTRTITSMNSQSQRVGSFDVVDGSQPAVTRKKPGAPPP